MNDKKTVGDFPGGLFSFFTPVLRTGALSCPGGICVKNAHANYANCKLQIKKSRREKIPTANVRVTSFHRHPSRLGIDKHGLLSALASGGCSMVAASRCAKTFDNQVDLPFCQRAFSFPTCAFEQGSQRFELAVAEA